MSLDTHTGSPRAEAASILLGGRLLPGGVDLRRGAWVSAVGLRGRGDMTGCAGHVGCMLWIFTFLVALSLLAIFMELDASGLFSAPWTVG